MSIKIDEDLAEMERKLKIYVDKGRATGLAEIRKEPVIAVKPDLEHFVQLKRINDYEGQFLAVDCSTRTLRRANNWGVYLMRPSFVLVKGRSVEWGYEERLHTVVGDMYARRHLLEDYRLELESHIALKIINEKFDGFYDGHKYGYNDYVLLDGASYFGGERKFRVSLYDECKKRKIALLALSKNSPMMHDEKGRDLMATIRMTAPFPLWVYPNIKKANKEEHLYGDISVVKLCSESEHVFRCDIMEYLADISIESLLSPLTYVSEDPRCLGYPIPLFLAHKFSAPSETMLLYLHDQIEKRFKRADLYDTLHSEELVCSFADELHGAKYAFNIEWIEHA